MMSESPRFSVCVYFRWLMTCITKQDNIHIASNSLFVGISDELITYITGEKKYIKKMYTSPAILCLSVFQMNLHHWKKTMYTSPAILSLSVYFRWLTELHYWPQQCSCCQWFCDCVYFRWPNELHHWQRQCSGDQWFYVCVYLSHWQQRCWSSVMLCLYFRWLTTLPLTTAMSGLSIMLCLGLFLLVTPLLTTATYWGSSQVRCPALSIVLVVVVMVVVIVYSSGVSLSLCVCVCMIVSVSESGSLCLCDNVRLWVYSSGSCSRDGTGSGYGLVVEGC